MSKLAAWLARILWRMILRRMRNPGTKALQRRMRALIPPRFSQRARASMRRQDQFARKYGLRMLTVALNIMFASFAITAMYEVAIWLVDNKVIVLSDEFRNKLEPQK